MIARALEMYSSHPDVLAFIAGFARAEYALKEMGHVKRGGNGPNHHAEADWRGFAQSLAERFDAALDQLPGSKARVNYLLDQPPKKQGFVAGGHRGGTYEWWNWTPFGDSTAEKAINAMKQVRNNLFHGGKNAAEQRDRDLRLVASGLTVLELLATLSPEFAGHFVPPP